MHAGERFKSGLKRAVRRAVETAPGSERRSVMLTYHSVGRRDHEMNVFPSVFAEQMRWLRDHRQLIPAVEAAKGEPGIAITFDDGYRDNLTHAAPVLDTLHIPATVFIVPGRMAGILDHDDPRDDDARLMTWDEVRQLARHGWTIGAHTMTHCRLAAHDTNRQYSEINDCKFIIEQTLGQTVEGFAYPFGSALDYNETSVRLVREAQYAFAVSNRYGVNTSSSDRFNLRRIWIDRSDTLASFCAKIEGRLDRLAWFDSLAGIRARRWANRLLQSA